MNIQRNNLNKQGLMHVCVAMVISLSSATASATDLKAAIQSAYQYVPALRAEQSVVLATEQDIAIAQSAFRPQLSLAANLTEARYANSATRGREKSGYQGHLSRATELKLSQRLFDYQLTSGQVEAANYRLQGANSDLDGLRESVTQNVVTTYIDVIRFRHLVELAKQNVADSESLMELVQKQVDKGRVAKVDAYLATSQLATVHAQLESQNGLLDEAEIRYLELMGTMPEELQAVPAIHDYPGLQLAAGSNEMDELIGQNPDVVSAQKEISASSSLIKSRKSAWIPRVDAELFVRDSEDEDAVLGRDDNYGGRLNFQWDIFSGGRNIAEYKKSKVVLDAATESYAETVRVTREAVKVSLSNLASGRARLEFLQIQLDANEKVHEAYQSQLKFGRRTPLDVFIVLNQLNQSRLSAYDAQYLVLAQEYDVVSAYGQLGSYLSAY